MTACRRTELHGCVFSIGGHDEVCVPSKSQLLPVTTDLMEVREDGRVIQTRSQIETSEIRA